MKGVRTVAGDLEPERLGFTLGHEHLIGHPPREYDEADLHLGSEDEAALELTAFRRAGGGAIVEMTTPDYARDVGALRRISERTGVHVVAATGFNQAKFADRYSGALSEEALAAWMVAEVAEGVTEPPGFVREGGRATGVRAGLIKASSSRGGPTPGETKVLRAAARAHAATGAPVSTHTEKGTWALEQAAFLLEHGVAPDKLLIGHLDFLLGSPQLRDIATLGVYLGLDQFSKEKYASDEQRLRGVLELVEAGHETQLILSGDLARRSYWSAAGGRGFAYLPTAVAPQLAALDPHLPTRLFRDNPRRFLAFAPPDPPPATPLGGEPTPSMV